jgi:DNA-binding transcriptional LysR family regulator
VETNRPVWRKASSSHRWLAVQQRWSIFLNTVISGLGIAYFPSFLYADAMRQGLIEDAIPDLPVDTQGIYAVYPPSRFTQPKVRAIIDFLAHAFADKGPADLQIFPTSLRK